MFIQDGTTGQGRMSTISKTRWVIGSGSGCDLVIPHRAVSRRHCQLVRSADGYLLEDLGSTNGTFVDGRRIHGQIDVSRNAIITLGRRQLMPWPIINAEDADLVVNIGRDNSNEWIIPNPLVANFHVRALLIGDWCILESVGKDAPLAVQSPCGGKVGARRAVILEDSTVYFGDYAISGSNVLATLERERLLTAPSELPATMAPRKLELSVLRAKMLDFDIIEPKDWERAATGCSSSADLAIIVDRISACPAPWSTPHTPCPRLTPLQRERLLGGAEEWLRIDDYLILERLAFGGMGEVFKVRDLQQNRYAAIKLLNAQHIDDEDNDSSNSKRFRRESEILAMLDHPGICKYFDAGEFGGQPYLVMECLDGRDFQTLIHESAESNYLPEIDAVLEFARQVGGALAYLHRHGVIHRDIKPSNVFLTEEGDIKLLDVGIARFDRRYSGHDESFAATLTQTGMPLGTPEYMAPEQWRDSRAVTPASDIYSLGCTLYCLLAGRPPFSGDILSLARMHVHRTPPKLSQFRSDIPSWFDAIVRKMLAKSPRDRFASLGELADALDQRGRTNLRSWFGSLFGA